MAQIAFILSMPNCASWNGKWSGEGQLYTRVKTLSTKTCDKILSKRSYYYNFGDGWGANVKVQLVDRKEANQLKKHSAGFCGYEWMIDSILRDGEIRSTPILLSNNTDEN